MSLGKILNHQASLITFPICVWIIIALSGNLYAVFGVYAPHIWNKVENCSNQKLISHTYDANQHCTRPTLSVLIYIYIKNVQQ